MKYLARTLECRLLVYTLLLRSTLWQGVIYHGGENSNKQQGQVVVYCIAAVKPL